MKNYISPPFLQPGDKIGIVAPASVINYEGLKPGMQLLTEAWGLEIIEGETLKSSFNQFSATDEIRTNDLQKMLDNDAIKAIFAARGGYGCSRIVDGIDFTKFLTKPKWLIGFSDLTALTSHIFNLGIKSIHGPMVKSMTLEGAETAADSLRKLLFGEAVEYQVASHPYNRTGVVEAPIVGGNLCLLSHLIGSNSELNTDGKVLFIEDINEYYYNLDRMLIQLKRAGKFNKLAGLIVGQFTDMKDNADPIFGKSVNEIIQEHIKDFDFPVCFDFPLGHVPNNLPVMVGADAAFTVTEEKVILKFLKN